MSTKALEQVLETMPTFGQTDRYQTIDVYASGTTVLYTPPPGPQNYGNPIMPAGPIGSNSNFQNGSFNNIQQDYNIGEMTEEPYLDQYNLTERYDFGGHPQQEEDVPPHLNQNINDLNKFNNFDQPDDIIGGGSSIKLTNSFGGPITDGYKGLGPAHHIDLFKR